MTDSIRTLAAAVTLQAVKEYFSKPSERKKILQDLRSPWMDNLTDGQSLVVAEQLENHPDEIKSRLRKNAKII